VYDSQVRNSIINFNTTSLQPYTDSGPFDWGPSTSSGKFFYCCAARLSGNGNITNQPQLFFGEYLSCVSPCRGAGSALYSSGTDIEGEPWLNPPSMGCDEFWEAALTNNLSVNVTSTWPAIVQGRTLIVIAQVTGRPSRVEWDFGDGTIITNVSYFGLGHAWTNVGDYPVTFTAFNAANPSGVSTNLIVHVIPLVPPTLSVSGLSSNRFNMSFAGQPGIIYILEQTPNLIPPAVWGTVTYLFGAGDILQATDTQATNAMRFYRVRIQ